MARPTVKTKEILLKIEEAAALGCDIEEIAFYANVHRSTMYRWIDEDPKLKDRVEQLQSNPILKARRTLVSTLDDPENAKWYLERKKKKEFSARTETDLLSGGKPILGFNYLEPKEDGQPNCLPEPDAHADVEAAPDVEQAPRLDD